MKKLSLLLLLCSTLVFAQVQVQSGTFFFDKSTPNYTLGDNQGKRTVEYEVTFNKPFETKPRVVICVTLLDAVKSTQVRYSVETKGVSRDGFVALITTWGSTQLSGIGGYWLAQAEKLEIKKEEIKVGQVFQLENVYFDFNKWDLLPASYTELDKVVKFMTENPKVEIELSGHTDNVGKPDYNMNLSQKRAESVRAYVLSRGVDSKRITAKGYGMNKPIASNETSMGRDQNRRVEFMITKK
jgi:outer membrane protein OmpA-like peptidoglycan-associated protein